MLHKNAKKKPLGCGFFDCGTTGIRTWDTRIFNPLLYQLSYGTSNRRPKISLELQALRNWSFFF